MPKPEPSWTRWLPLVYLVFGCLWILASDSVVAWLFGSNPNLLVIVSTFKGFAFVALTALLLAVWWRNERRRTDALLKGAEDRASMATERLAWMSRRASDMILLLDTDGRILDCNERTEPSLGYSRTELLAMDVGQLRPRGSATASESTGQLRRVRADGNLVFEAELQRKNGTTFPVEINSTRIDFEGQVYLQSIVRDISERKEAERARQAAEQALRDSEALHRRRVERQRDLYQLLSRCNHEVARVNGKRDLYGSIVRLCVERGRFLFALIGEARDDGSIAKAAVHGDDGGYVAQLELSTRADEPTGQGPAGRALREGLTVVANRFLDNPSTGPWHDLAQRKGVRACAAVPIRTAGRVTSVLVLYSGEPDFFDPEIVATLEEMAVEIGFGLDGLHLRALLRESRSLLQSVIDASATPVYVFDRDGRALLLNEAAARVYGSARDTLIGQTRDGLLSPAEVQSHRESDRVVLESGRPVTVEERVSREGIERVYLSVKFPLRGPDGTTTAVGGVATDITELRRAQEAAAAANARLEETVAERTKELVAARDRAERADRSKTAFLSTVSHELRTPLNSIIGFTDVVLQGLAGPLTDEQQRQLGIVQDSARLLLDLINEILDLSRIEAGRLQFNFEDFDLAGLLRRRADALTAQSTDKGLALHCLVHDSIGTMHSDPKRVAQIVSNLLANAIKFTPRGSVTLEARSDGEVVTLTVTDTGPGISPENAASLFTPFVQVGGPQSQHREGTGLGLAISRHLARALGGDITVESGVAAGACFRVVLPLMAAGPRDGSESGLYRKIAPGV